MKDVLRHRKELWDQVKTSFYDQGEFVKNFSYLKLNASDGRQAAVTARRSGWINSENVGSCFMEESFCRK